MVDEFALVVQLLPLGRTESRLDAIATHYLFHDFRVRPRGIIAQARPEIA